MGPRIYVEPRPIRRASRSIERVLLTTVGLTVDAVDDDSDQTEHIEGTKGRATGSSCYSEQQLRAAWLAGKDDDQLRCGDSKGCFCGLSVFGVDELVFEGGWPVCPRCGIDYVIGSASELLIEREFLSAVKGFRLELPFPDEEERSE